MTTLDTHPVLAIRSRWRAPGEPCNHARIEACGQFKMVSKMASTARWVLEPSVNL